MPPSTEAGFKPQWTCSYRRPKTPAEARRLYDHLRTVAYLLDASSSFVPGLDKLPFEFGLEAVIGAAVPVFGDLFGVLLGLYFVLVASLFGIPWTIIGWMLLNLVLDGIVGIVPVIGDALDVVFKANMHNLSLLERHLKRSKWAPVVFTAPGGRGTPGPTAAGAGNWKPGERSDKPRIDLAGLLKGRGGGIEDLINGFLGGGKK